MAAFAALLAGFSSCDTSTRQHRGGLDPEYPEQPSRPGEGQETLRDITLKYGFAEFWGQHHGDKTDDFLVFLYNGQFDSDGNFNGSELLVLDLVLPKKGDLVIKEGAYDCSEELGRTFIFVPAYHDYDPVSKEEYIDGSTLFLQRGSSQGQTLEITGGHLLIRRLISGYSIEGTVEVGSVEYTIHFKGGLQVEDMTRVTPSGEEFPGSDIFELKAKAQYNGEVYEGSDDYTLFLYYGEYDANGDFRTKGTEVVFEFLTKLSDGKSIEARTYPSTSDNFTAGYVLEGVVENDITYPSYVYRQFDNQGNYALDLITSANVTVSRSGQNYVIDAKYVTNTGSHSIRYEGPIPITDASGQGGGSGEDIPKNVEMKNITHVVAEDWGKVWDGIECTDYRDWILYFYDKDAETTNEYTCVEILTEEKYDKSLPEAKFSKIIVPEKNKTTEFVPGVIIGGYTDPDNNAWGTWYCKDKTAWYAASKGSLDIKQDGNGYSFAFDFVDEDEEYGGTFKGEYTGKVEFKVASTQSAAARRAAGKGLSLNRGTQRVAAPSASGRREGVSGRRSAGASRKAAPALPSARSRQTREVK